MDRLDKAIGTIENIKKECNIRKNHNGCPYFMKSECRAMSSLSFLKEFSGRTPEEESITLRNIDTHNMTSDKLYEECLRENEEFKDAVNYFTDVMASDRGDKDYLRKYFIAKILEQLQANINLLILHTPFSLHKHNIH